MSLAQLLLDTISVVNHTRAQAEAQLLQAREQNRSLFLHECSQELYKSSNQIEVRQVAGFLIKTSIKNSPEGGEAAWLSIDNATREIIKTNILATLAFPNDSIRNISSKLIAVIYPFEHNQNRWEELIPSLSKNANHQDIEIKKSAITALRELCEELTPDRITLSQETLQHISTGIFCGMQDKDSVDVQINALRALASGLELVKDIFNDSTGREAIEALILQALSSDNTTVKEEALRCVVRFVQVLYNYLSEWINQLWQITSELIKSSEKEVAILAIEIWDAIAVKESEIKDESESEPSNEKSLNLINTCASLLVPLLMQNLLDEEKYNDTTEDDEAYEDEEDCTVNNSTKTCLYNIAAVLNQAESIFLPFIQNHLHSEKNIERRAALVAYSCALESRTINCISESIPNILPILMGYLKKDNKLSIREAAAIALSKSAEKFPNALLEANVVIVYSELLISTLQSDPRVSRHIAEFWKHYAENLLAEREKGSKFDGDFSLIINDLIQNALRELTDQYFSLIDDSLAAAKSLIEFVGEDNDISGYLPLLLEQLNMSQDYDDEGRKHVETGLSTCLQAILRKHKFDGLDSTAKDVAQFSAQKLESDNKVAGLGIVGALASSLGSTFATLFDKFWPHIMDGLKSSEEKDLFAAATRCVSDLALACTKQFISSLETVLDIYWDIVNKDDCSKEENCTTSVIRSVGKIAVGCQEHILPQVNRISEIYKLVIITTSKMFDEGQLAIDETSEILREQILNSYLEFFRVVTQTPKPETIFDSLHHSIGYLMQTCSADYNPTVDYIRTSLSLLIEIVTIFGEKAKEFVGIGFIEDLITVLKRFSEIESTQTVLDHAMQVFIRAKFDISL